MSEDARRIGWERMIGIKPANEGNHLAMLALVLRQLGHPVVLPKHYAIDGKVLLTDNADGTVTLSYVAAHD